MPMNKTARLRAPLTEDVLRPLSVGDTILLSGKIFAGRDAVLPKIVELSKNHQLAEWGIDLEGGVVFHTAVSPAGVGPTSSNKLEIEESMGPLSEAGVKLYLGKGKISKKTVELLAANQSVFAVVPPVTALLTAHTKHQRVVAFPELGMEAFYELDVEDYPAVIAAVNGECIYQ